jgi:hypothetical protein
MARPTEERDAPFYPTYPMPQQSAPGGKLSVKLDRAGQEHTQVYFNFGKLLGRYGLMIGGLLFILNGCSLMIFRDGYGIGLDRVKVETIQEVKPIKEIPRPRR